jgi:hypothetical protein
MLGFSYLPSCWFSLDGDSTVCNQFNGDVERLQFSRYGSSDLVSSDQFWIFYHGFHEEDYPHIFCPGNYVLDIGDSYSRLFSDIDKVDRLLFADILVLVLLSMLIDYFNGCMRAHNLGIAA